MQKETVIGKITTIEIWENTVVGIIFLVLGGMEMVSNVMYKFSVFGDFSQLKYSSDNMKKLLDVKAEKILIPNVISQAGLSGTVEQRMQLVSTDHTIIISVLQERIDVEIYSDKQTGFGSEHFRKIVLQLVELMRQIHLVFQEEISDATRMALVARYVYFDISDEIKAGFRDRFVNTLDFYKDKMTDEFFVNIVGNITYKINNKDEVMNVVTVITRLFPSQGIGVDIPVDGYQIDFDINTMPQNKENRFNPEVYDEFAKQFEKTIAELRNSVLDGCE